MLKKESFQSSLERNQGITEVQVEGQTVPQLGCSIAEGSVSISFEKSPGYHQFILQMLNGGPYVAGFAPAALPDIQVPGRADL